MELTDQLNARSGNQCELCKAGNGLGAYPVPPKNGDQADECAYLCTTCVQQIEQPDTMDANHWRILNESIWSEVPAVQVLSYRMLQRLKGEGWTLDMLEMMYMDEETRVWAEQTGQDGPQEDQPVHLDSNGNKLEAGDTVVLIQGMLRGPGLLPNGGQR